MMKGWHTGRHQSPEVYMGMGSPMGLSCSIDRQENIHPSQASTQIATSALSRVTSVKWMVCLMGRALDHQMARLELTTAGLPRPNSWPPMYCSVSHWTKLVFRWSHM